MKEIRSQDESWRGVETRLSEMRRWTPDEEDIVREWISGKITTEIACQRTGRTPAALRWRTNMLGLYASERHATWRLINSSIATENSDDSRWTTRC